MQLLNNGKAQFIDQNGLPLANGTVGFYAPGTLNPLTTYQDQAGTIQNANPITLDSRGQAIIWGSGTYRQIVKDSSGVTIWDQVIDSPAGGAALSSTTGAGGAALVGFDGGTLAAFLTGKNNRVVDSIASLRALVKTLYTRAFVTGYYAAGDGGGGAYYYDAADTTSADNGGTIIVATDGGRWKLVYTSAISVKQFGAKGDGTTDDTVAIQKAITAVRALVNGTLYFPATTASYKITAPLTITGPISIVGDGPNATQIISSGMTSGQYMFDFNCLVADTVEYIQVSNLTIRSINGAPSGVRLKNASYVSMDNVRLYNLYNGIFIDGTRCFTHKYDNLVGYTIGNQTVNFAGTFAGGGQFTFNGSTFSGATGIGVSSGAVTDSIGLFGCNFEQCSSNGMFVAGTVNGLTISGGRTEGCLGVDFVIRPFGAAEYVGGLSVSGVIFSSSNAAGASRIQLGGDSGKVRGFNITGNTVVHSIDAYGAKMVTLNGDGESGIIAGNYIRGTTAGGAGVLNAQRAGVVVFGNENLTGKLPEYWGTADWGVDQGTFTPTDASGAGLTFSAATGKYTKIGRMVMWQAFVTYPSTANGANAEIGGLPYAVGTSISAGYAGARMDMTNLGTDVAVQHGANTSTHFILANRLTGASLTNATVSGKYFYLSGTYSM